MWVRASKPRPGRGEHSSSRVGIQERLDDPAYRQPHRVRGLGDHADLGAQVPGQLRVARLEQVGRLGGGRFADGPPHEHADPAVVQRGGEQVGGDHHRGALPEHPVVARVALGQVDRGGLDHGVRALVGAAPVVTAGDGRPAQLRGPAGGSGRVEHQHRPGHPPSGPGQRGELQQVGFRGAAQQRTGCAEALVHEVAAGLAGLGRREGAGRAGQRRAHGPGRAAVQRGADLLQRGPGAFGSGEPGTGPLRGAAGGGERQLPADLPAGGMPGRGGPPPPPAEPDDRGRGGDAACRAAPRPRPSTRRGARRGPSTAGLSSAAGVVGVGEDPHAGGDPPVGRRVSCSGPPSSAAAIPAASTSSTLTTIIATPNAHTPPSMSRSRSAIGEMQFRAGLGHGILTSSAPAARVTGPPTAAGTGKPRNGPAADVGRRPAGSPPSLRARR